MSIKHRISNGPPLMEILTSLVRTKKSHINMPIDILQSVEFTTVDRKSLIGVIESLERKDGSGLKWNITGYVFHSDGKTPSKFSGYYDSSARKGTFTVL